MIEDGGPCMQAASVMGALLVAVVFGLSIVPARAEYEIFTQRYSADPAPLAHAGRVWMFTTQ